MVLFPSGFHESRRLHRLRRRGRFDVVFDRDFEAVIRACAETPRKREDDTWINERMVAAYTDLHRVGIAHSVETLEEGELVGGLYGLTFGRAFFGESMFSRAPDASKLALGELCRRLVYWRFDFIDCQAVTPHLMSLGAVPVSRREYLERLKRTLEHPPRHERWLDD